MSISGQHFEVVILGAGMSGLAAGIRLALFGKKVLILERHNAAGGLNSFYSFDGRKFDVGLHALTNFVKKGVKGTPLVKLLRQLRIQRDEIDFSEQLGSRIAFPDFELRFNNDFALLEEDIIKVFPGEKDNFQKLTQYIREFDELALDTPQYSAKEVVRGYIKTPALVDALFLPLTYYGSAQEDDMDWSQFVIMFKSIFLEGFARPFEGVRQIIRVLLNKYRSLGGLRKMKKGVKSLTIQNDSVHAIELDDGDTITADHVISSIGLVETLALCQNHQQTLDPIYQEGNIGRLSFVEIITVVDQEPKSFGFEDTIVFFNDTPAFDYKRPKGLVDPRSGVICCPNNYQYEEGQKLSEGILRLTSLANYDQWVGLDKDTYYKEKKSWYETLNAQMIKFSSRNSLDPQTLQKATITTDMFTPTTIKKYTGHLGGAVYGAPNKIRDGRTPFKNLYICGTDQGFLGIIGAMLSGISMANLHVLSAQ